MSKTHRREPREDRAAAAQLARLRSNAEAAEVAAQMRQAEYLTARRVSPARHALNAAIADAAAAQAREARAKFAQAVAA